jgi:hypothetical protein
MKSLLCAASLAFLFACPSIDTGGDGGDAPIVVGPQGGLFIRNGYAVEFGPNAVDRESTIAVTIIDTGIPEIPQRKRVSFGYRFSSSTLKLNSAIKVFLPWLEDRVPSAVEISTFDMRRSLPPAALTQLPGARSNLTPVKNVEAQTDSLGLFWVTSPTEASVERLVISPADANAVPGSTTQYSAQVIAPTGETLDVNVAWAVVPARVATIDANGLLKARGTGTALVTARFGKKSAVAKLLVRTDAVGPSTFLHQNPLPTGNDLLGGTIGPAALGAVFCGDNGTIISNVQNQWTRLFSSPGLKLRAVGGTTLENAVAIGQAQTSGVLVEFKGAQSPSIKVFQPTEIEDLRALAFDGTFGMGVGTGNRVLLRRAGRWVLEAHPSFETLISIIGDGVGGFVVVGDLGSLYRWDETRRVWDSLYDNRLPVKLDAAVLVNATNGETWAVGGARLWHFTGTGWASENLNGMTGIDKTTSVGVIDGSVIIGASLLLPQTGPVPIQRGVILRRTLRAPSDGGLSADGGDLTEATFAATFMRGPQIPRALVTKDSRSYVVGDFGAIFEYVPATQLFREVSQGFYGDVVDLAATPTETFAAVNECTNLLCRTVRGTVMHSTSAGWQSLGTLPIGMTERIHAIAARSANEVVISTASSVLRFDGTSWTPLPVSNQLGTLFDLKYCGNTLWAAGARGAVYKGTATGLNFVSTVAAGDARSLWCEAENDIWVAGDGFMANRTGNQFTSKETNGINQGNWFAVYSPGQGEGLALGMESYGLYWDTNALNIVQVFGPLRPEIISGLWGSSFDNLYAVGFAQFPGPFGFALRFDGISWSLVDSGAHRRALSIDGASPTNIWMGTAGGGVLKSR